MSLAKKNFKTGIQQKHFWEFYEIPLQVTSKWLFINPYLLNVPFLWSLRTAENLCISDVYRGIGMEYWAKIGSKLSSSYFTLSSIIFSMNKTPTKYFVVEIFFYWDILLKRCHFLDGICCNSFRLCLKHSISASVKFVSKWKIIFFCMSRFFFLAIFFGLCKF